jgi:hypothetical protein
MARHEDDRVRPSPQERGAGPFIRFLDRDTLSLRQLDELNRVPKGTTFRHFKARRDTLVEGWDYFYLDAEEHAALIGTLRSQGRVYASTRHVVLLTESGYRRLAAVPEQDD